MAINRPEPSHFIEITRFYRLLIDFNRIEHLVLLGFTGFYWLSPCFTWFDWVLPSFYWVLLGFTRFYWVLPSFFSGFSHINPWQTRKTQEEEPLNSDWESDKNPRNPSGTPFWGRNSFPAQCSILEDENKRKTTQGIVSGAPCLAGRSA